MGYDMSQMGYSMPERVLPRIRSMLLARTDPGVLARRRWTGNELARCDARWSARAWGNTRRTDRF